MTLPTTNLLEWIDVNDRMPEFGNWYLVVERNQVNFLFYDSDNIWLHKEGDADSDEWRVTHWMPLPSLPNHLQPEQR